MKYIGTAVLIAAIVIIYSFTGDKEPTSLVEPQKTEIAYTQSVSSKSNENIVHLSNSKDAVDNYVIRFLPIAQTEMKKFKIPASIILAQGILESNSGRSTLAVQNNNHFGVKCFSHSCKKGHCSNFKDDSHKDFFVKYGSAWESFRAHSELLQKKIYKPLHKYGTKDYKHWAQGLERVGYATEKSYSELLISIIEREKLYSYDK